MRKRLLIILSLALGFILVSSFSYAQGKPPVLYFSDLTDGPVSGWEGSVTKGAAVSIWGNNFGSLRGTSYVTVGGVNLTNDSDYAEWGVVNNPPPDYDGKTGYVSARGLERITFWLKSNMQTGPGTIKVTTADGTSNEIPFYCRNTGNIYFISRSGSDSSNGRYATNQGGTNGPWFLASKVRTLQAGDVAYFRSGVWDEEDGYDSVIHFHWNHGNGEENRSITIASYPGEFAQLGSGSRGYVILRWGAPTPDILNYWTFSKFIMRSGGLITSFGTGGNTGSADNVRFIGNDGSTYAPGQYGFLFTGQLGGTRYLYFYGNHVHDTCVNNRGDTVPISGRAYGFYIGGYGTMDYIYVAWNEFAYDEKGRVQIFGHLPNDWIDNLYFHDNYIHDMGATGVILGGSDGGTTFVRTVYFYNNIIAENGHRGYPGIHIQGGAPPGEAYFYIWNNVFYHNKSAEIDIVDSASWPISLVDIKNNIIYASSSYYAREGPPGAVKGRANCYYGASDVPSWDSGSIRLDPALVDALNGDFHLRGTSPCINAGTSSVGAIVTQDFDGVLRPQGSGYDIGAYEYVKENLLLGDVNKDGKVDINDLILVAKDFGKTSGFNPGCDLNGDARVDIKDLIIVAKNFGKGAVK